MTKLDRAGLEHLVARYLDALSGHAANRLPLAGNVRYTENGVQLALDDGLWGTPARRANTASSFPTSSINKLAIWA